MIAGASLDDLTVAPRQQNGRAFATKRSQPRSDKFGHAARSGLQESEPAQRRKTLNAQQAVTIQALRGGGLAHPQAIAAMHPALARVQLAYRRG